MNAPTLLLASFLALLAAGPAAAQQEDLRDRFGTRSAAAAKQISIAIDLSRAKKGVEARKAIDDAIRLDPQCQLAPTAATLPDQSDIKAAPGLLADPAGGIEAHPRCPKRRKEIMMFNRDPESSAERFRLTFGDQP